ncbi:metal-binding protein [Leptolyngbya sp. PCC 6406]|uniref:metal-binding protein n=1 Tax=Leptolyngbya sp. PCC 6406 TaxID=1173264 RepID=UPI0002ABFDED|nr:metal-binding protein [Leptolyngbya sp. PCC 6406]
MPSGRTHDRITWFCLPCVGVISFALTQHLGLATISAAGFLFGGLMFGPDLDVRSRQTNRWGHLGWIWRPYRGWLRHRSWLSHGPLAGTLGRLLYLGVWILIVTLVGIEIANQSGQAAITWGDLGDALGHNLWKHRGVWLALVLGIETGAMSHSLSDWTVSWWKRTHRRAKSAPRRPRSRR